MRKEHIQHASLETKLEREISVLKVGDETDQKKDY